MGVSWPQSWLVCTFLSLLTDLQSHTQSPQFKLPPVESQALEGTPWPCSLTLHDMCQSMCRSDCLSPAPWLCPVEGNDWVIIHCRIMMVQQPKCQRLLIDCQTEQSASVCVCVCVRVDNSLPGKMTVWRVGSVSGCTWTWFGAHSDSICCRARDTEHEKETE